MQNMNSEKCRLAAGTSYATSANAKRMTPMLHGDGCAANTELSDGTIDQKL